MTHESNPPEEGTVPGSIPRKPGRPKIYEEERRVTGYRMTDDDRHAMRIAGAFLGFTTLQEGIDRAVKGFIAELMQNDDYRQALQAAKLQRDQSDNVIDPQ